MTEIGFLLDAGAVAFTDCDHVVTDTRVFQRCLTYADGLWAPSSSATRRSRACRRVPATTSGQFASLLGLPAVSPIAERIGLERDLAPGRDDRGTLPRRPDHHGARPAGAGPCQDAGFDVTAGTSIHHLTLNEFDVGDYRTFFKLKPPLRSEDDRMAMVEALAVGSDRRHRLLPHAAGRGREAPALRGGRLAAPSALETLLPAAMQLYHAGHLGLPQLWRALALNPAQPPRPAAGAPCRRRAGRPRALRSRHALRPRPFHPALEVEEHPLRPAADAGTVLATWVAGQQVFTAEA